jgi:hypothetical protein
VAAVKRRRLDALQRLAELRRTPRVVAADFNARGRAVIADFEDWRRLNPDAGLSERGAALDEVCRRHDFPTLDELEADLEAFDG